MEGERHFSLTRAVLIIWGMMAFSVLQIPVSEIA